MTLARDTASNCFSHDQVLYHRALSGIVCEMFLALLGILSGELWVPRQTFWDFTRHYYKDYMSSAGYFAQYLLAWQNPLRRTFQISDIWHVRRVWQIPRTKGLCDCIHSIATNWYYNTFVTNSSRCVSVHAHVGLCSQGNQDHGWAFGLLDFIHLGAYNYNYYKSPSKSKINK